MTISSAIKCHGGKAYLAKKLIALMPPHTRFCETHFGSGAVLLQKSAENVAEYANDLNHELTTFWRCLQDPILFKQFAKLVNAVPFSQVEYKAACGNGSFYPSAVSSAARFFVRNRQSRQGLGRDYATPTSRLRRGMNEQVSAWLSAVDALPEIHARLRQVEIRQQDAIEFIQELDSPDTLFYLDPPYLHATRASRGEYGEFEMTEQQHAALLVCLSTIKGKFVLSSYQNQLYANAAKEFGWRCVEFKVPNQASSKKQKKTMTECAWLNYDPPVIDPPAAKKPVAKKPVANKKVAKKCKAEKKKSSC